MIGPVGLEDGTGPASPFPQTWRPPMADRKLTSLLSHGMDEVNSRVTC